MTDARSVLVYGAYGLTGRFVVTELVRRGLAPVLGGRSAAGLAALADLHPDLHVRLADAADPESLDRALAGGTPSSTAPGRSWTRRCRWSRRP